MFRSWDYFKVHLTLPELTLQQFFVAEIWGDAQITWSGTPLAMTSIASKQLFNCGTVQVQQVWNDVTHSWKLPEYLFHEPTLRMKNSYNQLLAKLKSPDDFPADEARFVRLMSDSADWVLDTEASGDKAFFQINSLSQNVLTPALAVNTANYTHVSIPLLKHRGRRSSAATLHSYEDAPPQVQRIAATTWRDNSQLHEITPRQLRRHHPARGLRLVCLKLLKWLPSTQIQFSDSARWSRLWNSTQSIKEACFLWQVLFNCQRYTTLAIPTATTR